MFKGRHVNGLVVLRHDTNGGPDGDLHSGWYQDTGQPPVVLCFVIDTGLVRFNRTQGLSGRIHVTDPDRPRRDTPRFHGGTQCRHGEDGVRRIRRSVGVAGGVLDDGGMMVTAVVVAGDDSE